MTVARGLAEASRTVVRCCLVPSCLYVARSATVEGADMLADQHQRTAHPDAA